jgi:hypothetical protein
MVERYLEKPFPIQFTQSQAKPIQDLETLFLRKRMFIEMDLIENLKDDRLRTDTVLEVNAFFGSRLIASLTFNDPSLVAFDLDWVIGLLAGRQIDQHSLIIYLVAYKKSIEKILGNDGELIRLWIDSYLIKLDNANKEQ